MEPEQRDSLAAEVHAGGTGYVRDLAAAEVAVLRGQFNLAKVLRALAHTQRAQALAAARLLIASDDPAAALRAAAADLAASPPDGASAQPGAADDQAAHLQRLVAARRTARAVAMRALSSLATHRDVSERDVAPVLWGCHGCGALLAGDPPDACPVCGALAAELEWFGPFYSSSPEHLGQLAPGALRAILAAVPGEVAAVIAPVAEAALRRKPTADEWCAKELVGHMLETDLLFQRRVRAILADPGVADVRSPIPPWRLHEGQGYEDMATPALLRHLSETRAACLDLVGALSAAQWSRRGDAGGTLPTVLDLGTWLANHDRGHLAQLRALCAT